MRNTKAENLGLNSKPQLRLVRVPDDAWWETTSSDPSLLTSAAAWPPLSDSDCPDKLQYASHFQRSRNLAIAYRGGGEEHRCRSEMSGGLRCPSHFFSTMSRIRLARRHL